MDNIIPALQWRYATKHFDHKKIPEKDVNELLEVARLAPSSFGLALWKFALVENPQTREKIRAAAWNQAQVTDASHLLVFLAKDTVTEQDIEQYIELIADTRGMSKDDLKGYHDMMAGFRAGKSPEALRAWNDRQLYIPLGMVLLAAAQKHIDACPMEGFDPKAIDAILEVEGYHSVAMVALGHRSPEDKYAQLAKVRSPADDVIVRK